MIKYVLDIHFFSKFTETFLVNVILEDFTRRDMKPPGEVKINKTKEMKEDWYIRSTDRCFIYGSDTTPY